MLNSALLQGVSFMALLLPPQLPPATNDINIDAVENFETIPSFVIGSSPDLSFIPPPAGCVPAPDGLVSWWRAQSSTVDDWDSNDGPGPANQPFNPPLVTYSTGKVGLAFAGSFIVEDSVSLRVTNGFTIEAWINLGTSFDNTNRAIFSKWGPPVEASYILGCTNRSLYLQVSPSGSVADSIVVRAPQPLPLATWIHVAATYDGATLQLYTNGSLVASAAYSQGIYPGFANVGIGRVPTDPNATTTTISNGFWNWRGLLDEVSLYNRALSQAEIQGIVNADSLGKCLSSPTILVQPASQSIPMREDVMFSAQIRGAKPITYRWTSNGVPLLSPALNLPRLLIEKVQTNNAGIYSLFVSNALGTATSSNAVLSLLPTNVCYQPPLGITNWWPGDNSGVNLLGFPPVTTVGQNGTSFPFTTGKVASAFGKLTVPLIPPLIPTGTWSVANGPTINFAAANGFSIEAWIKGAASRRSGFLIRETFSDTQTILQKVPSAGVLRAGYALYLDRGRLTCSLTGISNTIANVFSSPGPDLRDNMFHHIGLTVNRNATDGGHLYVDGQSVATFDTRQIVGAISNGVPLTLLLDDYFSITQDASINVLDEPSFYGRALTADEMAGIANAGAAGKCKTRPVIRTQPASQTVALGSVVTFSVVPNSTGFLRYTWSLNGSPIPGATNSSLIRSNVTTASAGLYSVRLDNIFGPTFSSNALLNLLPVAVCSNITVAADPSTCTANASIDAGSYDPEGKTIMLTQVPPGPYPLGTTPVTLIVVDNFGASNACTATVTVLDQTPPQITCPTVAAKVNDPHQCGAIVQYPLPAVTDTCSPITNLVCIPPSGSFFPVGTTTVQCTATDGAGNSSQCSFTITVVDSEPPSISCPGDLVVTNAHDAWSSVVSFQIQVSDNCPGLSTAVAVPPSGSAFALGTNLVSCVVTDAAGNVASCSFNVIVMPGNHAPVPDIQIWPLAHFPGWTNLMIIAPRGVAACVHLSGRKSVDPDGDPFSYQWFDGTNLISTNVSTRVSLGTGTHDITLALDDHFPLGTKSAMVTVEIIAPADALALVIAQVQDAGLLPQQLGPLMASLNAAVASFRRGNFNAGENQLQAFEHKTLELVGRSNPSAAEALISGAEQIVDAIESDDGVICDGEQDGDDDRNSSGSNGADN